MNWLLLAGSLGAVLLLALAAWALGLGGGTIDDPVRAAEEAIPGFRACESFADASAAIVIGADDRVALLKRHGAHIAARSLPRPIAARCEGATLIVATGERWFGDLRVTLADERQARDLAAMLARAADA